MNIACCKAKECKLARYVLGDGWLWEHVHVT